MNGKRTFPVICQQAFYKKCETSSAISLDAVCEALQMSLIIQFCKYFSSVVIFDVELAQTVVQ
jgi:hypothetical protein